MERLQELGQRLPSREGQILQLVECDLGGPDGTGVLVARVRKCWTRLDILVNNAGILGPVGPLWENEWDAWTAAMMLNVMVPVQLCRSLIPMMNEGGSVINISGGGATSPRPHFSAYASSKAALVRFSETLAVETATLGIRVNCIAPGIMRTRMVEQVVEIGATRAGSQEHRKAEEVLKTGGTPPETPAELAVLLASEHGRAITGKLLSAAWDPWKDLPDHVADLAKSDVYTLRRIVPSDRGMKWGKN